MRGLRFILFSVWFAAFSGLADDTQPWLTGRVPHRYWQTQSHRIAFLQWFENEMGISSPDGWYGVSMQTLCEKGGRSLVSDEYQSHPYYAAKELYPGYDFKVWLFNRTWDGYFKEKQKRIEFLRWFEKEKGLKTPADWYQIRFDDFAPLGGSGIMATYYRGSVVEAAKEAHPHYEFLPWYFTRVPQRYWQDKNNRIYYLNWLGKQLGFETEEDWYALSTNDFRKYRGDGLLSNVYKGHILAALGELFPNRKFDKEKFSNSLSGVWKDVEERRRFLRELGVKLGATTPEGWYRVSGRDFRDNGGAYLLAKRYHFNVENAARELYPDYDFKTWLFVQVPQGYWQEREKRVAYMDWLGRRLGYEQPEDWYRLSSDQLRANGGGGILYYFDNLVSAVVRDRFPDYAFQSPRFNRTPWGSFDRLEERQRFLREIAPDLGVQKPEDWYHVKASDFARLDLANFLTVHYAGHPYYAAKEHFPDYEYLPWLFSRMPLGLGDDVDWRRRYVKWLGDRLGFTEKEDWYRLTWSLTLKHSGGGFIKRFQNSPYLMLNAIHPEWELDRSRFSDGSKMQRQLYQIVTEIFPEDDVYWNYKHPELLFEGSGRKMELDIFVKDRQIAFEYQGEQHENEIEFFGGGEALEAVKRRDEEKRVGCGKRGIKLFAIPHTWDGSKEDIISRLHAEGCAAHIGAAAL